MRNPLKKENTDGHRSADKDRGDSSPGNDPLDHAWRTVASTLGVAGYSAGLDDPLLRKPSLPIEKGTEPIVGWKAAMLLPSKDGRRPILRAVHHMHEHSAEAKARCARGDDIAVNYFGQSFAAMMGIHTHSAPDVACSCGFYAWADEPLANQYGDENIGVLATLRVDLYGKVIVAPRGYRAEYQRILGVYLDGRCAGFLCTLPGTQLDFTPTGARALCENHLFSIGGNSMATLPQLAGALGCEVNWRTE